MTKTKINATVVADSIDPRGNRITTILGVIPRIILAELNTHRMFSRNSASSRAIPFKRMVEAVQNDPFIPIAWQEDHSGMQGTNYITHEGFLKVIEEDYLIARNHVVGKALILNKGFERGDKYVAKVTKQLCNRLLEPFMWHTVLITSTEWENFFELRCPQYVCYYLSSPESTNWSDVTFKSKKDFIAFHQIAQERGHHSLTPIPTTLIEWLQINKSVAEIHIQAFAEAVWDAMNEHTPQQLQEGEWHIPYSDKIDTEKLLAEVPYSNTDFQQHITNLKIFISTAMCARTSYTTIGEEKEMTYEKLIEIHDKMANQVPFHASPFEHCARVMTEEEYELFVKGTLKWTGGQYDKPLPTEGTEGWCRNFRGFIQYRHILETKNI